MNRLFALVTRRRLYESATFLTLGLQVLVYVSAIVLWATGALNKHSFSLSRVGFVSQAISLISQVFVIASLTTLTFLVQALAFDRTLRRRQTLAALQDSLSAWQGLASSITSIWRGPRLEARVKSHLFVVFVFFAAGSILHIVTPATLTVESFNATVPIVLDAVRLYNVSDVALSSLSNNSYRNGKITSLGSLPYAIDEKNKTIAVPPGVEQSIWFSTLRSPGSDNITFTDSSALRPSVQCSSIPRHSSDIFEMVYDLSDSATSRDSGFMVNVSALITPNDNVIQHFSTLSGLAGSPYLNNGYNYQFGGEKARKSDPPNKQFNDNVIYLEWSDIPDNSSYTYGTIAFTLLSIKNNLMLAEPTGIDDPITTTMTIPVYSWLANDSLTEDQKWATAFRENLTVSFNFWPIACSLFIDDVTVEVYGNNTLASYSTDNSTVHNPSPFVRSEPLSPLIRNWAFYMDAVENSEGSSLPGNFDGQYAPTDWMELRLLSFLNKTTLTSSQKLSSIEADLASITSVAYSLVFEQIYSSGDSENIERATSTVLGLNHIPLGRLQIHGPQVVIGCVCTVALLFCVLIVTEMKPWVPRDKDPYILSGEILDLIYLMRDSTLPQLLNDASPMSSNTDARRSEAESLVIEYTKLKLDSANVAQSFPSTVSHEQVYDALELTEKALARVSLMSDSSVKLRSPKVSSILTKALVLSCIGITLLSAFHATVLVLWALKTLDQHYFDLSQLGRVSQLITVASQICSVATLAGLAYVIQTVAADKFIRRTQTVQDLNDSVASLSGLGRALSALWNSWLASRTVIPATLQLFFFWCATAALHITIPATISVTAVNVSTPVLVEVSAMPGHIIDIGANFTMLSFYDGDPFAAFSTELINIASSVPFVWDSRNTSIRLPSGLEDITFFSIPNNVSSNEYILEDPFAQSLSARCGVLPNSTIVEAESDGVYYNQLGVTPQTFNQSFISVESVFQYTRGNTSLEFGGYTNLATNTSTLLFGGEKPDYNSPPNLIFQNILLNAVHMTPNMTTEIIQQQAIVFLYISMEKEALSVPREIGYASPGVQTRNITVLSWVNDTNSPTTKLNGQPVRAFNESVEVTFYTWPLGCILVTENATASVSGDGTLLSANISSPAPYHPFPYLTNVPKNPMEANFAPLFDALSSSEGVSGAGEQGGTWFETSLRTLLAQKPTLRAFEDALSSITSLAYALLIQRWRTRSSSNDNTLASNWIPQTETVLGHFPVLKAHLQVNAIPLLIGSISTLILAIVSLICIIGHEASDHIVRDGGVIDIVSLMYDSALPGILAPSSEESGSVTEIALFETRSIRAQRTAVAYGDGSLDLPARVQRRQDEHFASLHPLRRQASEPRLITESTSLMLAANLSIREQL